MGPGPSYREIALLLTMVLAIGVWFAVSLGVPYGAPANWPRALQWLNLAFGGRTYRGIHLGDIAAGIILLIGLLIYRGLEKDDSDKEARPPRWLFTVFCFALWGAGVWIVVHWGLSNASPAPSTAADDAAYQAIRATTSTVRTTLAVFAAAGLAVWMAYAHFRK